MSTGTKFTIRMPQWLHTELAVEADLNSVSLNEQIQHSLEDFILKGPGSELYQKTAPKPPIRKTRYVRRDANGKAIISRRRVS